MSKSSTEKESDGAWEEKMRALYSAEASQISFLVDLGLRRSPFEEVSDAVVKSLKVAIVTPESKRIFDGMRKSIEEYPWDDFRKYEDFENEYQRLSVEISLFFRIGELAEPQFYDLAKILFERTRPICYFFEAQEGVEVVEMASTRLALKAAAAKMLIQKAKNHCGSKYQKRIASLEKRLGTPFPAV